MCGRYVRQGTPEELAQRFQTQPTQATFNPSFNVAPTMVVPVIVARDDERYIEAMRWGILPKWRRDGAAPPPLINARSETVAEKPTFRKLLEGHRCLVPASGFYEWERTASGKIPHYFSVSDQPLIAYAGLYEDPKSEDDAGGTYTILTTAANELIAPFHDRMPVILQPGDEEVWLDEGIIEPAALESLYTPFPSDLMAEWTVSRRVNNARIDEPDLIRPAS